MSCVTEDEVEKVQFPQRSSWTTAGRKLWAAAAQKEWQGGGRGYALLGCSALAACGGAQNYVMLAAFLKCGSDSEATLCHAPNWPALFPQQL